MTALRRKAEREGLKRNEVFYTKIILKKYLLDDLKNQDPEDIQQESGLQSFTQKILDGVIDRILVCDFTGQQSFVLIEGLT